MPTQIGRLEGQVELIQFDVTDLRQDVKAVLQQIGDSNENGRNVPLRLLGLTLELRITVRCG